MTDMNLTIGTIVAKDYRTAKVFEDYGIDFCCGGKGTLAAACTEKGIDQAAISRDLEAVQNEILERSQNYFAWELPFLADYIVNVHHNYLEENIPQIVAYLHKISGVHGANHPELIEITAIFNRIASAMPLHLREEEVDFFPAIKRADQAKRSNVPLTDKDIKTIKQSLANLVQEHEEIGDAIHKIHDLAKGYAIPHDVCNTFTVTYLKLKEFEDDLHKHVHLENNVLFPKAMQL